MSDAEDVLKLIWEMHKPRQASWSSDPKHVVCSCNTMYPCRTVQVLKAWEASK